MSRYINGSGSYLTVAGAPVTAAPLTIAAWVNKSTTNFPAVSLNASFAATNFFALLTNGGIVSAITRDGGAAVSATIDSRFGNNWKAWVHCAGVFASITSRQAFADGVAGTVETTSKTPAGINETDIGRHSSAILTGNGLVADVAIWNAALGQEQIRLLAGGMSPLLVRATALVAYWPLVGNFNPEPDRAYGRYPVTQVLTMPGPPFTPIGDSQL